MHPAPPVKQAPAARATRKPRGAFHHGNLRQAAIERAMRDVERHGHDRLSLNRLAHELGVTGPALYRHFADRRALLDEVGAQGFVRFEERMTAAATSESDPWRALLAVGRAYVDFAREHPNWFRLQFLSDPAERFIPDLDRTPPRYRDRLMGALAAELGPGSDLAASAYLTLWAVAHGVAVLTIERVFAAKPPREQAACIDRPLETCVAGLRALARSRRGAV